jgi:hypothetical protein
MHFHLSQVILCVSEKGFGNIAGRHFGSVEKMVKYHTAADSGVCIEPYIHGRGASAL